MNDDRPTQAMDPLEPQLSWQSAVALLERLGPWTSYALRLGTLALLQECIGRMTDAKASRVVVLEARTLMDALLQMPWEGK